MSIPKKIGGITKKKPLQWIPSSSPALEPWAASLPVSRGYLGSCHQRRVCSWTGNSFSDPSPDMDATPQGPYEHVTKSRCSQKGWARSDGVMDVTQRMRHCQYQCYHICMYVIICVTKCIYELLMYIYIIIYSSFVYCICNMWVSTHPHDSPCACCAKLPKGPPAICVKSKVPSLFCFITCWRMNNKIAFVKVVLYLSLHI